MYYYDTSVWTEGKSYTFTVLKLFAFHLVASPFFSDCAERPAGNVDILIFALGLKTDCSPVSSFFFLS